jgi:hypothetical protein
MQRVRGPEDATILLGRFALIPAILHRSAILLAILGLAVLSVYAFLPLQSATAADASAKDQCVECHTNPAKLKALTPPDPPAAEEGEG